MIKIFIFFSLLTLPVALFAQAAVSAAVCKLEGANPATGGSTVTYRLHGCKAGNWKITCGQVSDNTDSSVTIYLNDSACKSTVITALSGGSPVASQTVIVTQSPGLAGGMIGNPAQTISFHSIPGQINASLANGGVCNGTYIYQWYTSSDNQHFKAIPGATSQNYQPGRLDSSMYFKRQTSCNGSSVYTSYTSNTAIIQVSPALKGTGLSPAIQSIDYHTIPASLSVTGTTGGDGSYIYRWQSASIDKEGVWQTIPGATSSTYSPGVLDSTTFYRVRVLSNADSSYQVRAVVNVWPALMGGMVSPVSQAVDYDQAPQGLSITGAAGGNGNYTYQWYSSTDSSTWMPMVNVVTPDYSPGGMETTTYYRVVVTGNGMSATGKAAAVYVNPTRQAGKNN